MNAKGFKVLRGVGVIQGDGININTLQVSVTSATPRARCDAFVAGF